ncbi:MAG: hypothetical protein AAF657_01620, partial [Acidobacteriota bacterium]
GRGATRNPWLFQQIATRFAEGTVLTEDTAGLAPPGPSWEERRDLILDHFRTVIAREEPGFARYKLQIFMGLYSKGLPDGIRLRRQIHGLPSLESFLEAIEEFFDDLILKTAA